MVCALLFSVVLAGLLVFWLSPFSLILSGDFASSDLAAVEVFDSFSSLSMLAGFDRSRPLLPLERDLDELPRFCLRDLPSDLEEPLDLVLLPCEESDGSAFRSAPSGVTIRRSSRLAVINSSS